MNALNVFSQKLLTEGHYESVAVASRRDAVLQRLVVVFVTNNYQEMTEQSLQACVCVNKHHSWDYQN